MFRVKICGITNWPDARLAVDLGADALGFNFYPRSPRFVPGRVARRIIARLPRAIAAVGIFVDDSLDHMRDIGKIVGLSYVQLHGSESPTKVRELASSIPVIKAFRMRKGFRLNVLAEFKPVSAFLLDSFSRTARGGTGKTFNWAIARRARRYGKIILAGGLSLENVAGAIRQVRPAAVDVCSGVESRPGKKDARRLRALMQQIESVQGLLG